MSERTTKPRRPVGLNPPVDEAILGFFRAEGILFKVLREGTPDDIAVAEAVLRKLKQEANTVRQRTFMFTFARLLIGAMRENDGQPDAYQELGGSHDNPATGGV